MAGRSRRISTLIRRRTSDPPPSWPREDGERAHRRPSPLIDWAGRALPAIGPDLCARRWLLCNERGASERRRAAGDNKGARSDGRRDRHWPVLLWRRHQSSIERPIAASSPTIIIHIPATRIRPDAEPADKRAPDREQRERIQPIGLDLNLGSANAIGFGVAIPIGRWESDEELRRWGDGEINAMT